MEKSKQEITEIKSTLASRRGQILPGVIITGAVLAIFGYSMLRLFQNESKLMVKSMDIMRKQELASTALEHARYKIQTGSFWYQLPLKGFIYDKEYDVPGLGTYALYIAEGNLFLNSTVRQGETSYRTIGIKVKVKPSKDTRQFYAVVKRVGYGGPLISKGKINLPCTQDAITNNRYNFLWGDVYSANPADDACHIPVIPVGRGSSSPQNWGASVYAAGNIYTAVGKNGSNYVFGYTYDDMSPTARSHPYSSFARAPDLTLNTYKALAKEQGNYYGPPQIGGAGANPYYIDEYHTLSEVTAAKIGAALKDTDKVFFIDTTDGLPVRVPGNSSTPTNTYCGTTYTTTDTLGLYSNCAYQYYAVGSLLVMGPFVLKGDNPETPETHCGNLSNSNKDPFASGWPCKYVTAPDNYYYPQASDSKHYTASNQANKLENIKLAGFLYVDGELTIGGPRCTYSSECRNSLPQIQPERNAAERTLIRAAKAVINSAEAFNPVSVYAVKPDTKTPVPTNTPQPTNTPPPGSTNTPTPAETATPAPTATTSINSCPTNYTSATNIAIYGTVYIGEHGQLRVDTANDPNAEFHFYYNEAGNAFGFLQQNVIVTSFKELTFLVPTPMPIYPF
jgi:hypothetical protein